MIVTDIFLVTFSLWLAFALRLGEWFWPSQGQKWLFITAPFLAIPIFIKFGLYRAVIRFIGHRSMLTIAQAAGLLVLLLLLVAITFFPFLTGVEVEFPRSMPILFWMALFLSVGGSRQIARSLLSEPAVTTTQPRKSVLIYGAGRVGLELASSLSHSKDIQILGIIDDDLTLHGHYIKNLKVLGGRSEIAKIRATTRSLEVLLAMPKIPRDVRKELLKYLEDKNVAVRTMPSLGDIASRAVAIDDLRDVDITDLLARKAVVPNRKLLAACITNKKILITGAGGSIGSELCRQALVLDPVLIVLFDHSELNLYKVNAELVNLCASTGCNARIIPILGSVTHKRRVEETIKNFAIDTIYHAAAYKHVALIENNIEESVLNNIFGTYNVAQAALNLNVERFVLISTDKAVRPSSVMGATKRIAEQIVQGLAQKGGTEHISRQKVTRFIIVRFGNVLGSSGSVVPLFQQQIASGGPITITHPETTRYFMTIPEASQLVIQAGAMGSHCSTFALEMGDPVSILSLAKQLVYLSGRVLKTNESGVEGPNIEIQYTGLKKGEKIHEELFIGDNITSTEHPMILEAKENFCEWSEAEEIMAKLKSWHNLDDEEKRQLLMGKGGRNSAENSQEIHKPR